VDDDCETVVITATLAVTKADVIFKSFFVYYLSLFLCHL